MDLPIKGWYPKFAIHKWPFYDHFWSFFVNYVKNFHKTEVPTVILRYLTCLNLNWISGFFCKLTKLTKTDESMKCYFSAILWISFDQIIVQAPSIPHFKGLGMRNLEYEIRVRQKTHTKVTMAMSMLWQFFLKQTLFGFN